MTITSDKPSGIIEPGEILNLPLEIKAKGLEELHQTAKVHITGQYDPYICKIEAIGKGPEVHFEPANHRPIILHLVRDPGPQNNTQTKIHSQQRDKKQRK